MVRIGVTPMRITRPLERLRQLGWRQRLLLVEAMALLAAASVAIKLLPFRRAVKLGAHDTTSMPRSGDQAALVSEARWSVEAAARRLPWRAVCFQQGIALQSMLRRRGIDARLHYGVRYEASNALEAHVWICDGDTIVIGGEQAPKFKLLAVYP